MTQLDELSKRNNSIDGSWKMQPAGWRSWMMWLPSTHATPKALRKLFHSVDANGKAEFEEMLRFVPDDAAWPSRTQTCVCN